MNRRKPSNLLKEKIRAGHRAALSNRKLVAGSILIAFFLAVAIFLIVRALIPSAPSTPPEVFTAEPVKAVEATSIQGNSAIVVNIETGEVIIEKDPDITVPIASITKIATATVALQYLDPNDIAEVRPGDFAVSGGSSLRAGDTWRITDLMEYALITSSNEAVNAIARVVSEKRNKPFTEMLNEFAQKNNLFQTHFVNPSGLDIHTGLSGSESSARDVANLLTFFYRAHPSFAEATSLPEKTFITQNGTTYRAQNTNKILSSASSILASKTGYTTRAGGNLGVIAQIDRKPFVLVVLGSSRAGRFTDIKTLIKQTKEIVTSEGAEEKKTRETDDNSL